MEAKVYTNFFFGFIFYGTAECTAADAFKYAGDHIVFASGSPFENVNLGNFLVFHHLPRLNYSGEM